MHLRPQSCTLPAACSFLPRKRPPSVHFLFSVCVSSRSRGMFPEGWPRGSTHHPSISGWACLRERPYIANVVISLHAHLLFQTVGGTCQSRSRSATTEAARSHCHPSTCAPLACMPSTMQARKLSGALTTLARRSIPVRKHCITIRTSEPHRRCPWLPPVAWLPHASHHKNEDVLCV